MAQSGGLTGEPARTPSSRPTWTESDAAVSGRRIHVRRAGEGAPLLLLHGLGASGVIWQSFARRLVPAWAPLAPDLPGHGQSDPAGTGGYATDAFAGDLIGLLDALTVGVAPVVGHSLGALVALAMAALHPRRVPAAVLLDPPLDPARRNRDVAEVYRLRHEPPGALEAYLAEGSGSPLAARALAPVFRQADDAVFSSYLSAPPGAPWAWDEAPHVAVPVLVVQADPALDGVLGDEAAEGFVARLPRGRLVKVPGARHAVHASHPQAAAAAVLDFLASAAG